MNNEDELVITLKKPVQIGDNEYKKVTIWEPTGLAMMGLSGPALAGGYTDHVIKLLPKITEPRITEKMAKNMRASDLNKFIAAVSHFLIDQEMIDREEEAETVTKKSRKVIQTS